MLGSDRLIDTSLTLFEWPGPLHRIAPESFLLAGRRMIRPYVMMISAHVSLGNRLMTYIDRSKYRENHD
jgi:hypothetical protein